MEQRRKFQKKFTGKKGILFFLLFSLLFQGCAIEKQDIYLRETSSESLVSENEKERDAKEYSGTPYQILNQNQPEFTKKQKKSKKAFEKYSRLDSLGRCGVAFANICKKLMPTGKREEIGMIKPTGWHTVKYDIVDGKYLYNRCHLIGYQLAGENANKRNLITGTRYLNVEGMLPFENEVADYVERTGNHVLYRVTPVFKGKNLLVSGVKMEAFSVEDKGKGVCFNIFAYNIQPGVEIDYATGESKLAKEGREQKAEQKSSSSGNRQDEQENRQEQTEYYIINKNTRKFHYPDCSSVKETLAKNKKKYSGDRKSLIEKGYEPCGKCNP